MQLQMLPDMDWGKRIMTADNKLFLYCVLTLIVLGLAISFK